METPWPVRNKTMHFIRKDLFAGYDSGIDYKSIRKWRDASCVKLSFFIYYSEKKWKSAFIVLEIRKILCLRIVWMFFLAFYDVEKLTEINKGVVLWLIVCFLSRKFVSGMSF